LPVLSRIGNAAVRGGSARQAQGEPVIDIDRPEKAGVGSEPDSPQALGNRILRAAFAYGEVMHLLFGHFQWIQVR
jgi:hypothetical protein